MIWRLIHYFAALKKSNRESRYTAYMSSFPFDEEICLPDLEDLTFLINLELKELIKKQLGAHMGKKNYE